MMRFAVAAFAVTAASLPLFAQSNWDKNYNVSSKPNLQVEVDDASVRVRSCGGCRAVHIHVEPHGQDLSRWHITDMQGGSGIQFAMKHQQDRSFLGWHGQSPEVIVETPGESDLSIRSGDGSLAVAGVRGSLDLKTGNGSVATQETNGALRVMTGDGSVRVQRAEGTLNASTGDGSMLMEGRFSQLNANTGNGSINLQLLPGSSLQSSSRVNTGDGSISMSLPRDLRADLQVSTGDGHIATNLAMQTTVNDQHNLHGLMNGGGPTLRVHSGDGSIALNAH